MLKDTKSDTQKKRGSRGWPNQAGSPGFNAQEREKKKEQYHNRRKGRVRASMKHDNNGNCDNERKSWKFYYGELHPA